MGGKSGGEIEVYEYTMSMHVGICAAGEGLSLLSVKYGEKEIWSGQAKRKSAHAIHKNDLFGGRSKEGGAKGIMTWLPGDRNQSLPAYIWSRLGLTRTTAPGFRGLASLFFSGTVDEMEVPETDPGEIAGYTALRDALHEVDEPGKQKGFHWGTNNPYLRAISARVRRAPVGLNPSIALIPIPDSSQGRKQFGANPAHIIFECMTNRSWGMGERIGAFDVATFEECARTLYDEGFALNMIWTRQAEIKQFIDEVLDHIQGAVYVDAATGRHTMKLLRGDYDVASLPQITPSNAELTNFRRKVWGDIANEVTVTMTVSETGKEATVSAQDLAAIAAQGGVAPSSKNYYGVPYKELAIELAERDLAAQVQPLATCDVSVSRQFWDSHAGEVLDVTWPEFGIERLIMRVSKVERNGHDIKLSLYEDIFGLERASYLEPGRTEWVDPTREPEPLVHTHLGTAPAFITSSALGLTDPGDLEFPEAFPALVLGATTGDDLGYDLTTMVSNVNGTSSQKNLGTKPLLTTFVLPLQLIEQATSYSIAWSALVGTPPAPGDFIQIGSGDDRLTEIVTVESATGSRMTINRGVLDTVPRYWPAGTRAWVIPVGRALPDRTVRSVGEVVRYWPRTRTSGGVLPLSLTPELSVALTDRAYRPNRPANVAVNGSNFGPVTVPSGNLTVTWANRNRTLEATQVMKWENGNVAPEAGQVTQIDLLTLGGAIITSFTGLAGTSHVVPRSAFGGATNAYVRVVAVRDGRVSLQGHQIEVVLPA